VNHSYLVTGGMGFIGRHLVERLVHHRGAEVEVIDNLSTSMLTPETARGWVAGAWAEGRLEFTHRDLADCLHLPIINTTTRGVFHLASPVGPVGVLSRAGTIASEIVNDTIALAERCALNRVRMVFVSTSEVYGGGFQGLCREDFSCTISPEPSARLEYALGKLAAECALVNMSRREVDPLDVVIVRPFNVAGPYQNPAGGFVLPRFIRQAHRDQALTVYGEGEDIRAFTHVADLADGLLAAFDHGASGEVYNLGNIANKISIKAFAEAIIRIIGKGAITYVEPKQLHGTAFAGASNKFPDARKANRELKWYPSRGIDSIIREAYAVYLDEEAQYE
jgi:nucleoside-diphosphate-sugar epimerase